MIFPLQNTQACPVNKIKVWSWLTHNLFSSPINILLTILCLSLFILIVPPALNWLIFQATFSGQTAEQCTSSGACWIYIYEKFDLFIYGFYPQEQHWRPHLVLLLALTLVFFVRQTKQVNFKKLIIYYSLICYPVVAFFLLYGGFGLVIVPTDQWGGLLLTVVIASTGILLAMPIGVLLALGRISTMPIVRYASIVYIEFIRGVPLISILFMASVVLPLFLASGTEIDKLLRALVGITLFQAAYIAEIIRGGLQAIPKGQHEASAMLGLSYWQKNRLIILPQVFKIALPNLVGSCIGLFKDTTLVLIIGLFDMLAMVRLTTSDTHWLGLETEGYIFVTLVFWIILYLFSRQSKVLERKLAS